jgi:protein-disulfide isomerase
MPVLLRWIALMAVAVLPPRSGSAQTALDRAGHDLGARTAPIEVIEFHDLGCSQCARFTAQSFGALEREFIATGKVRWKSVPFVLGSFRHSAFAAEAAECAAEQDKFFPMHDALLAQQGAWKASLSVPHDLFRRIARSVGVDTARFGACVRSERTRDRVRAHKALAQQFQIYGTPTFIVQREKRILGAVPGDRFAEFLRAEVQEELVRAARARMARPPM